MKILLIEDNQTIAKQLGEFLSNHQWSIDYAHNGLLGIQLARDNIYDVVLLDLNLPDIDGLEVCEEIKNNAEVTPPILMLTARDTFTDKSHGFSQGADDYLTKPYDLREVALRCQALSKRSSLHQPKSLILGDLKLDLNNHQATRENIALKLTSTGFSILKTLMQEHPLPVSRSALIHQLWGDEPPETDALKSHIYGLRNVLDKPFDKPLLTTVLNVGFKLDLS